MNRILRLLRNNLTTSQKKTIRDVGSRLVEVFPFFFSVGALAIAFGTDKYLHGYWRHYERLFSGRRWRRVKILEIGVGGYADPESGGESLRLWRSYFPLGKIYSIDIYDKRALEGRRIKIFRGSQNDVKFLEEVARKAAPFDIMIDDGSHVSEHIITSFKTLFPHLKQGGIYAVEDIGTSYSTKFGGDPANPGGQSTAMSLFKSLADGLNYPYIKGKELSLFDLSITSIQFLPNMVIVEKGINRTDDFHHDSKL